SVMLRCERASSHSKDIPNRRPHVPSSTGTNETHWLKARAHVGQFGQRGEARHKAQLCCD
ncbi:hypothetical protein, partial [Sphingomonas sp. UMB7805-LC452B]